MKKNWVVHPLEERAVSLAREINLHPAVISILLRRGYTTSSEIFSFLDPSIDSLQDPFAFEDMGKAVDRLRRAIADKERILVYGDYDVDGITGSAILYPALKGLGADVEAYIPHRMNEGYGLNKDSLEKLLRKKFTVVVTVDNGITGVKEVRYLKESGVDVIIVDHHLPKEGVPPAYAIVSGAIGDGKGDANLAACGLAFKVVWALLGTFEAAKEYLDLVALGTVADQAAVLGDNRILLRHGLPVLAKTKRPGLRALMEVAGVKTSSLSFRDIAFGLGPRINASGRMGSPDNAFKLLTTDNETLAKNLAKLLDEGNRDRQRVEAAAYEEAVDRIEEGLLHETDPVLVVHDENWHEGVLGIVAARLVDRYKKPSIVIAMRESTGKGSGRSVPHFSIFDSVLKCEELLESFGGHAQACGLSIRKENVTAFKSRLNECVRNGAGLVTAAPLEAEAEIALSDIDIKFLRDLERLAPFGPGNRKPVFLSRNLKFKGDPKKRGKDTLCGWVTDEAGSRTCEIVGFRAYDRWIESRAHARKFDLVYQPQLKEYQGIVSVELGMEDWS